MRQRARQQGKSLTPEAERLLLTLQGPDLLRLSQEVDKLCLFVGERQEIDPEAVEALGRVGMLGRQLGPLVRAKEPLAQASPPAEISRLLGVPRPFVSEILEAADISSLPRLEQGLARLLDVDRRLKQ